MRFLALSLVVFAVAAPSAGAQPAAADAGPSLRTYLIRMGVQMRAYHASLARADHAFEKLPESVATARFHARSGEFKRLAARIKLVRAPRGLGAQHRRLVNAIQTVSSAFTAFAAAREQYRKDSDQVTLIRANTAQRARLHAAESLQLAWARAVRTRTINAGLIVPGWLHDFFT